MKKIHAQVHGIDISLWSSQIQGKQKCVGFYNSTYFIETETETE